MECFGYIITNSDLQSNPFVKVLEKFDDVEDKDKPVLIVGYYHAKEIFGDKCNILEKKIIGEKNIYWTFGINERRDEYLVDIQKFNEFVINNLLNKINYYYINIILIKYNKLKNLINIINNNYNKYIYIYNNMIYIYYENYIIGISINIIKYFNINIKKIFKILYKNKNNIIETNDNFLDKYPEIKKIVIEKRYIGAYALSLIKNIND